MVNGKGIDVRALIATAGMLASVTMGTGGGTALARPDAKVETTPVEATLSAAATLEQANDLIANGKAVRAKMLLQPLASEAGSTGLSTSEHERVYRLLTLANTKIKAMSPVDVSLQTAEGALASDELALARAQAQAVVDAPKATNEQVGKAKGMLARVETRQGELSPVMAQLLDDAAKDFQAGQFGTARTKLDRVSRSGVTLASADAERLADLQSRVVDQPVAAGMLQPGVVKPREDQPETKPAEQPATPPAAQAVTPPPAADAIEMSRKAEAQSLFVEADQAYELRRMNEAASRYQRLKSEYFSFLSAEQQKMVNDRLSEARVVTGSVPTTGATSPLQELGKTRDTALQLVRTEFDASMQQGNTALATGDTERARSAAAAALLKLNSGRDLFSAAEFETRLGQQKDLATRIAQDEVKIRQQSAEDAAKKNREQATKAAATALEDKERKISEAVGRVRALQAEMKYKEALQVVDQILFLDPINPTGLLMKDLLQDAEFYRNFGDIQRRKTQGLAREAVDNQDAMVPPTGIVQYPTDWPAKSYQRGGPTTLAETEDNRRALATLAQKRVPVNFEENRLEDVLKFVQTVTNLNMDVDWQSLANANIDKETQVSMKLTNVPVRTVLDRVMEKLSPDATSGAGWTVNDGVLTVASKEALNKNTLPLIYDIRDLLVEVPNYTNAPEFDLQSVLQNGGQGGGGGQSPFRQNNQQITAIRRTLQERTDELIRIITSNIDSQSWLENGGEVGKIQQFQGNLIITQTANNHRAVVGLLSKLREQRSMQINVETRFLLVGQDFFEQIGVDFDVYFNGRSNQVRTARQQAPNNSVQPSDFFDFGRGGLQRRVFGAPIDANGDGQADPVVGNPVALPSPLSVVGAGQNSLGLTEGLTQGSFANTILSRAPALGVAGQFLDDIQVDFLVKATQANRRSVSLTAPRLTFTNGQTSNIYVATQVSFVSDLTPVVSESAVGFDPTLNVINEGVRLLVDGTISADRRYVTMNVDASVARIESFENRAITAVAGGQLVNSASTQSFIQLPTTTVTRVQTTVTVPDQGTILLGGQRVVTEGEVETGVPVLSKIPIINRLFTNRTETKEEQTLLILIKPTILIQNEEEAKNFPGLDESLRSPFGG